MGVTLLQGLGLEAEGRAVVGVQRVGGLRLARGRLGITRMEKDGMRGSRRGWRVGTYRADCKGSSVLGEGPR